jgi:Kef-type K+ transport system membrane component KefB
MVGYFLLSDDSFSSKLLLAIIICNTSTGLLFAILSELKAMNTLEGRIITGATILTEIIVILTFGITSGIATKGEVSVMNVLVTAGIAFSFLAVVLIIVLKYGERFGNFLTSRVAEGLKISIVIILSLLFAFISGSIGLHGVIGAFAAGLLLRNVKLKDSDDKEYSNVERIIRPYYMILVPILFVRVGAQVDLKSILNMDAVLLGLAITGAAVIGKLFCSVCPIEKGINRMAIGIGMAMKLEGTLILSGIGRDMGILNDVVFSSIIMVIVFTSITCPSLLKVSLVRQKRRLSKNFHVTVDEKTKEIYIRFKNEVRG